MVVKIFNSLAGARMKRKFILAGIREIVSGISGIRLSGTDAIFTVIYIGSSSAISFSRNGKSAATIFSSYT